MAPFIHITAAAIEGTNKSRREKAERAKEDEGNDLSQTIFIKALFYFFSDLETFSSFFLSFILTS
jgi:hypothetical protein